MVYNPVSGWAELWIDGVQKATFNVGVLPSTARYMNVYLNAWGWYTGHYNQSDDLAVSQPWTGGNVFLSANTPPASPVVFNFTATKKTGGTETVSRTISGYVTSFATPLTPTGNISANPTFSWNAVTGASSYSVQVSDANGNRIWNLYDIPPSTTSVIYNSDGKAPALVSGQTYYYEIVTFVETDGINNESFARGQFTYAGSASTITVSGFVRGWNGEAIPEPGVTVSLVGNPSITATADPTTGNFSLAGVPANTPFALKFSRQGYLDLYSVDLGGLPGDTNINADAHGGAAPFNMATANDLTAFGAMPPEGKALISGRVSDLNFRYSTNVGGATVTALGLSKSYPVTYRDPFGGLGGTATFGNGRYYVLGVDGGDTVTLTTTKNGWTFGPRTFHTQGNAMNQGRIWGTAPGYNGSISGFVKNSAGLSVGGATVALNGDPNFSTVSAPDGAYTFNGLPKDANFYARITASGYVPTFAGPVNLPGSVAGVNVTLLTPAEMTGFGVATGNGLLGCQVLDASMNPLSGATVKLTSKSGTAYTVNYAGGSGATSETGRFVVPNVTPGDVVKIEVSRAGYAFNPVYLDGFGGAMTAHMIIGSAAAGNLISNGGFAGNLNGWW